MLFTETKLAGSYVIEIEKLEDERGFFSRSWDTLEFKKKGLETNFVQCNISFNKTKGILRGLHYQKNPHWETKIIRCTKGRIYDVIVDLRNDSPTKNEWVGVELTDINHKMIYIPDGFAHGFQTLENNCEVFYQMSKEYNENSSTGKKWNSSDFNIIWPITPPILSKKDKNWNS